MQRLTDIHWQQPVLSEAAVKHVKLWHFKLSCLLLFSDITDILSSMNWPVKSFYKLHYTTSSVKTNPTRAVLKCTIFLLYLSKQQRASVSSEETDSGRSSPAPASHSPQHQRNRRSGYRTYTYTRCCAYLNHTYTHKQPVQYVLLLRDHELHPIPLRHPHLLTALLMKHRQPCDLSTHIHVFSIVKLTQAAYIS